jgi:hypothetical protein
MSATAGPLRFAGCFGATNPKIFRGGVPPYPPLQRVKSVQPTDNTGVSTFLIWEVTKSK